MAIPPKCRTLVVFPMLLFSLPVCAQVEGIIAGILKLYAFSLLIAFVVLILMLLGTRTRKVLLFPILLAVLATLPLARALLQGGTSSAFTYALIGGFIAPWIFVVTSLIAAVVSKARKIVPKRPYLSEGGWSLWLSLNVTLPLAALLAFTRPLDFSITHLMHQFAWFVSFLGSHKGVAAFVIRLALDYFLVATILLKVFDWIGVWRWLKPASSGANVLAAANVIILFFFLAPLGSQSDPKFQIIRELTSLYVWTSMLLALIGYLIMINASISGARSDPPYMPPLKGKQTDRRR